MSTEGREASSAKTLRITSITDPPGLAIAGDVDFRSLEEFTAAVTQAVDTHRGDVHLDLSQVAFIEVSGMRVLAEASRQLARQNRRLVLKDLAPHLRPVLQVVGWSQGPDEPKRS
ncbi:MAG TPA: STAS domain-containing protein [Jiangellaceae bacterium]|nr:STAS domain-containing protein [Jiangellaceae bacterium]